MRAIIISFISIIVLANQLEAQTIETQWLHSINTGSGVFLNNYSKFLSTSDTYIAVGVPLFILTSGYLSKNEEEVKKRLVYSFIVGCFKCFYNCTEIQHKSSTSV
jgi:surface polysaccharide O-acyltransferase-like enzyme